LLAGLNITAYRSVEPLPNQIFGVNFGNHLIGILLLAGGENMHVENFAHALDKLHGKRTHVHEKAFLLQVYLHGAFVQPLVRAVNEGFVQVQNQVELLQNQLVVLQSFLK